MSLLNRAMREAVRLVPESRSDGEGGSVTVWAEKETFSAAIVRVRASEAESGDKKTPAERYTVTVPKVVRLMYHDVFRRKTDGKVFRVTSDGDEAETPESSPLSVRQVSAEEWQVSG